MDGSPEQPYRCHTTADYKAVYPDPITTSAGEELQIGKKDPDNEAWVWCTGKSGKSGWVPVVYIRQHGDTGTALRDYAATELSVCAGGELFCNEEVSGWIWCTNGDEQSGWVPAEKLSRIARGTGDEDDPLLSVAGIFTAESLSSEQIDNELYGR
ncbi:MAG: hypothetical protein M3014_03810 [Chloroflexota bacterium]|nr:hypothetical protein [Chloroflexota bacterium]